VANLMVTCTCSYDYTTLSCVLSFFFCIERRFFVCKLQIVYQMMLWLTSVSGRLGLYATRLSRRLH